MAAGRLDFVTIDLKKTALKRGVESSRSGSLGELGISLVISSDKFKDSVCDSDTFLTILRSGI